MAHETINGVNGGTIKAWIGGVPVEESARHQFDALAALPFIFPHVARMPDVHMGKWATVGSVIPILGGHYPGSCPAATGPAT